MRKRLGLSLLFGLCLLLLGIVVVRAKLPPGYAHTRGLYILFDVPDLNMNPPQLPVVGGVWRYNWRDLEPTNGGYNWNALDAWVLRERDRGKLAAVGFSFFNEFGSEYCEDRGITVPAWVRTIDSGAFWQNTRRPNGDYGVCKNWGPWYVPNYWNSTFRSYYQRFINAFAQHLKDTPEIANQVVWVSLGAGLSGETQPSTRWKDSEAADWYFYRDDKGVTTEQWIEWVNWCSNMYKQAFSSRGLNIPLFLDIGPTYSGTYTERDTFSAYAASIGVGLRHNGLLGDHPFAVNYNPMINYWNTVPTAWESYQAFLPSRSDVFWGLLCGLSKRADNFSFDKALFQTEEYLGLFRFAASYCGVTTADTPGAWVGLRDTQQGGGERGNYSLFLTQKDDAPNGRTVAEWSIGQNRGYKFDVANGTYQVDLHFAEVYYNSAGARVFDIKLENAVVESNFDIWVAAGGKNRPIVRTYSVNVTDGLLDIDLVQKSANEPTLHAIRVSRTGFERRVNCGGASYRDSLSNLWLGDQEYQAGSFGYIGGVRYTSSGDIIGTTDDYLYQTMRIVISGAPALGRFCRRTDQATGNTRMRFDIDNNYMYYGSFTTATITVTYFSSGTDRWELRYDAIGDLDKVAVPVGSANPWVQKDNSGVWKRAVFYLTDARFANGQPGSTDFSINCLNDGNEWISFVEVTKGGGVPSVTPTPTPTVIPCILQGKVTLQGRPAPPNDRWVVPLTVRIGSTSYSATTDSSGNFVVSGLTPGTYNICVKNSHTLSNRRTGVTLVAGTNTVDFGTLREGDANNDDFVTIVDFSMLAAGFFPSYNAAADFNQDGYVNINDFSLLALNFGANGDCAPGYAPPQGMAPLGMASAPSERSIPIRLNPASVLVRAGEIFTMDIQIDAGDQPFDGAEVHLDFDPHYLQVVDEDGRPADRVDASGMLESELLNRVRITDTVGQIDFAAGTLSGVPASNSVTLATIRFKVLGDAGQGDSRLAFVSELPRKTESTYKGESMPAVTTDGFVFLRSAYSICLPLIRGR